jgi:hypothetical protein
MPKYTCEELGVCQGKGCGQCRPDTSSTATTYPFAPQSIEHTRAREPSAMAYAKSLLRVVRNIAIFLFLVLFAYLAWYWPEIWVDAQAKHAQNMLDAATSTCSKEVRL